MNIPKLRQVQGFIIQYPEHFDIHLWSQGALVADKQTAPSCGTVACIAGWAVALEHGFYQETDHDLATDYNVPTIAQELLELTLEEASCLFLWQHWEEKFKMQYVLADSRRDVVGRAQAASDYIDFFIETNQ